MNESLMHPTPIDLAYKFSGLLIANLRNGAVNLLKEHCQGTEIFAEDLVASVVNCTWRSGIYREDYFSVMERVGINFSARQAGVFDRFGARIPERKALVSLASRRFTDPQLARAQEAKLVIWIPSYITRYNEPFPISR